jgi:MYXO-CTERM domain-containing protein
MVAWSRKIQSGQLLGALLGMSFCALLGCSDRTPSASGALGRVRVPLAQALASETEPNGSAAQATSLGSDVVVRANVVPDGDEDFYSFTAQAGSRVYAATQTAWSSATDGSPPDSAIDIVNASGTVLETDDDNGTMTGLSSSIAGTSIPSAGTYFVRVRKVGGGELRPYDLHFRRREGSPIAEVEPNDDVSLAEPLPASGWMSGSTLTSDDVDVVSFTLAAGSTVFASLDLDPERDGVEWDGMLEFGQFDGSFLRVNDQPGPDDTSGSEALFATVRTAGDYYLRVSSAGAAEAGSYVLSASVHTTPPRGVECHEFPSYDAPLEIPEGPGRVTSSIYVIGNDIVDVDVHLELTHSNPEDLDIHLRSPAGNDNALFTDVGSAAFPNIDITIDDEAAFPLTPANDPHFDFTGQTALSNLVVQPEVSDTALFRSANRLHWFDGEYASGEWTLVIDDDAAGNSGTLESWSISVCDEPGPHDCPGGSSRMFALNATFDGGEPEGFTHSGTNDVWALGVPSFYSGFSGCEFSSFDRCWKTNLDGYYSGNSTQDLVSPEVDLTNARAPITVSWTMKYQLESATYDHAWVEVREKGGANPKRVWEFLDATMLEIVGDPPEYLFESAGWGVHRVDVSEYAGKKIEVIFHLDSDAYVESAGLAIDKVQVIHCGCGDGILGPGEDCDDGDRNNTEGSCCNSSCRPVANANGCDDLSICTYDEVCTDGVCGGGKPVNCNDGNHCTDDSCAPAMGCVHEPNTEPCRVGTCHLGMCVVGGMGGGGAGGAGSGGAGEGGEGGSSEAGAGTGARGGTVSGGGEGGETTGGTGARGGASTGGTGAMGGTSGDPGGEGGEAVDQPRRTPKPSGADTGCGCRVPGGSSRSELPALLVLALGAGIFARRRRSRWGVT